MVSPDDWMNSAATASQSQQEIEYRNCISRAYYGVFHAAHAVAKKHFPGTSGDSGIHSHKKLIGRFTSSEHAPARRFGTAMHNLKLERCRADYQVDETVTMHEAIAALSEARKLCASLETCIPPEESPPNDACDGAIGQHSADIESDTVRSDGTTAADCVAAPTEFAGD